MTVIEAINAEGYALPEFIIIPGKLHMESWYETLELDALVVVNDLGYSNDLIAVEYIQHFIHFLTGYLQSPYEKRLLLLNGHDSYKTKSFLTTAEENNIVVCAFLPHTTHLIQPLDVSVFKQCKHFHQKAITKSIQAYETDYSLSTFLQDLPTIRLQSLTPCTILFGWRKAGLWLYNPFIVLEKLWEMQNIELDITPLPAYDINSTSKTSAQTIEGIDFWQKKAKAVLSSPSQPKFQSFMRGTTTVLYQTELYKTELDIITIRMNEQRQLKARSRRSIQCGGQLYASDARARRYEKEAQERAKCNARDARESEQAAKQLIKMAHRTAIEERKTETARVKALRARGLKSKVVVLRYCRVSEIEQQSDSEGSFIDITNMDSDNSSIDFILHRDRY